MDLPVNSGNWSTIDGGGNNSSSNLTFGLESPTAVPFQCYRHATLETVSSYNIRVMLTVLYTFTSILSLISNGVVILVQFNSKKVYAHNFRKYLINLAVSDIIIGVFCVPFTYTDFVFRQWVFPHWLCPTAQYAQLLSVFVTSISLTIIGLERYCATMKPLSSWHRWFQGNTHCLLSLTWVLGAAYACIPLVHTGTKEFQLNNQTYYQCSYGNGLNKQLRHIFLIVNFVITFLIPSVILTLVYLAIMHKINGYGNTTTIQYRKYFSGDFIACSKVENSSSASNQQSQPNTNLSPVPAPTSSTSSSLRIRAESRPRIISTSKSIHMMKNRSKTMKILLIIILVYDLCWLPIKLFQILLDYEVISYCTEGQFYRFVYTYIACHWLAMANSFANPIVYSFMSQSFRNDFQQFTKYLQSKCHTSCPTKPRTDVISGRPPPGPPAAGSSAKTVIIIFERYATTQM